MRPRAAPSQLTSTAIRRSSSDRRRARARQARRHQQARSHRPAHSAHPRDDRPQGSDAERRRPTLPRQLPSHRDETGVGPESHARNATNEHAGDEPCRPHAGRGAPGHRNEAEPQDRSGAPEHPGRRAPGPSMELLARGVATRAHGYHQPDRPARRLLRELGRIRTGPRRRTGAPRAAIGGRRS